MTKKGYQKRVPTVLPVPPPRAVPPTAPPPRASSDDLESVQPPPARPAPPPPAAPTPPPPTPLPVRSRHSVVRIVAVCVAAPAAFALGVLLTPLALGSNGDRSGDPDPGSAAPASPAQDTGESYVETQVLDNGVVAVRHSIRLLEPVDRILLALPDVPGSTGLSADRVVVMANGRARGPRRISGRARTYTFAPTRVLQVSYRMTGAVSRSSTDGRALVLATSLDVTYPVQREGETRIVRASEVLSLACARTPTTAPAPCGTADDREQWRVELPSGREAERVIAQVNLG